MVEIISRRKLVFAGLALALFGTMDPAYAQRRRRRRRLRRLRRRAIRRFRHRHGGIPSEARDAVRRGDIRPLRDVLAAVSRRSDAEVLDVDLHEAPRGWVYALRVLTPAGRVRDVFLDARTLEVLQVDDSPERDGISLPPDIDGEPRRDNAPDYGTPVPPPRAPIPPPPIRPDK